MIRLRLANAGDFSAIRSLVYSARLNPMGLDWRRFVVATSPEGYVIGCGQIKPHRDGSRELASIVVRPDWRGQGVARAIIENLLAQAAAGVPGHRTQPLYLTCRAGLQPFYERFGFQVIGREEMPPYFRRIHHLANLLSGSLRQGEVLLVMRREFQRWAEPETTAEDT